MNTKVITSMTVLTTAEGKRLSITHSELDDKGNIISENQRTSRVVMDEKILGCINDLEIYAKSVVNETN